MKTTILMSAIFAVICMSACAQTKTNEDKTVKQTSKDAMSQDKLKSKDELKKELSSLEYQVTQCSATEPAFNNMYWDNHNTGVYYCRCCGNKLFDSDTKYDSGTGWPSFFKPASAESVSTKDDTSYGMIRTEVTCKKCGAHLGHLFDDGPKPTGMRYCMNSASMRFEKK